jgi:RNA polymerase sigma-70 factor (ECF subfamily)
LDGLGEPEGVSALAVSSPTRPDVRIVRHASCAYEGESTALHAPPATTYVRLGAVPDGQGGAYDSYDDAALGDLIAQRDPAAIEELYDRHGAASYGLARRVVADEQLAQDVVQEVFLAIWRGAATYDGSRGSLSTWLFALTHHKSVDAVRRSQRHSGRRAPEEALSTEADPAPGVDEQAFASVRRDQVRAALAQLPEPQRKALLLAYFGGFSQSEIAQLTGTPLGTVKTRTLAALRRLRAALDDAPLGAGLSEGEGV